LPGVARQSARRRRKLNHKKCNEEQGRQRDQRQAKPSESTSLFAHPASQAAVPTHRAGRWLHGGELTIKNKFRRRYVGTATLRISRGLMLSGNSTRLTRINADLCLRRNILTLVSDLDRGPSEQAARLPRGTAPLR